jgi:hypothetical protein
MPNMGILTLIERLPQASLAAIVFACSCVNFLLFCVKVCCLTHCTVSEPTGMRIHCTYWARSERSWLRALRPSSYSKSKMTQARQMPTAARLVTEQCARLAVIDKNVLTDVSASSYGSHGLLEDLQ